MLDKILVPIVKKLLLFLLWLWKKIEPKVSEVQKNEIYKLVVESFYDGELTDEEVEKIVNRLLN